MRIVDATEALNLLTEVVAEKGDSHTSGLCQYFDDADTPRCIVGHVFAKLGVDGQGMVNSYVNDHDNVRSDRLAALLYRNDDIVLDSQAVLILSEAQDVQDGPYNSGTGLWGDALIAAKATYNKFVS